MAQSGEVLAQYPEHWRLMWLDSLTALLLRKNGQAADLVDLASGKVTAAKGFSGTFPLVLPVPGHPSQFVAGSYQSVVKFELRHDAAGVRLALLDQRTGPPMS